MEKNMEVGLDTDKVGAGEPAKASVQPQRFRACKGLFAGTPAPTGTRLSPV